MLRQCVLSLLLSIGSKDLLVNANWFDNATGGGGEIPCMIGFEKGDDGFCYLVRL